MACVGGDVVFAKCWLAKHWVAPLADYVVFDAAHPWPIADAQFDLVMCHDSSNVLPDQPTNAARLRAAVAPRGVLAVGHLHNGAVAGGAKDPARAATQWAALFPDAAVYRDAELLAALMGARAPCAADWTDDPATGAWSIVEGGPRSPRTLASGLAMPPPGASLVANPLLGASGPRWPSPRYEREYAAAPWLPGAHPDIDAARTRRVVDLPERW